MTSITQIDYSGAVLPVSGAGQNWIGNGQTSSYTVGTAKNDVIYGNGSPMTLAGGAGDDTYYIYGKETVVEAAGGGTDTIIAAYTNVLLPANVENLTISGNYSATGNSLANIIIGDSGNQIIDGGAGNDVLTGGGGSDVFVSDASSGHDVITDFNPAGAAVVRLAGYTQFTSFAQVQAAMTQSGSDVVLTLDGSDSITFRNTKVSTFTASDFQLGINTSTMHATFTDDFNSLSLHSGTTGTWTTNFELGLTSDSLGSRTIPTANEQEIYVDPGMKGQGSTALGLNPFSISNGILTITEAPTPVADQSALYGYKFTSGLLTTKDTFSQEYGYYEIKAQLPSGTGAWPDFWLLPTKGGWPPELDIMEGYGGNTVTQTAHTGTNNTSEITTDTIATATTGFHTYGMLWDAQHITWYVDGVEVAQIATPADMHQSMYMLLDLAVSKDVTSSTLTSQLEVDYIHVYSLADSTAAAGSTSTSTSTTSTTSPSTGSSTTTTTAPATGASTSTSGASTSASSTASTGSTSTSSTTSGSAASGSSSTGTTTTPSTGTSTTTSTSASGTSGSSTSTSSTGSTSTTSTTDPTTPHILSGTNGNDVLVGVAGTNVITGGAGNDTMTGGVGHNTFVFAPGFGHDTITNFNTATDTLDFSAFTATALAHSSGVDTSAGALLTDSTGDTVLLAGVHITSLSTMKNGIFAPTSTSTASTAAAAAVTSTSAVIGSTIPVATPVSSSSSTAAIAPAVSAVSTASTASTPATTTSIASTPASSAATSATSSTTATATSPHIVVGTSGNDVLTGVTGTNVITGGAGNDTMTGGTGHNTFVFAPGFGHDIITNFNTATDTLDFTAFSSTALAHASGVDTAAGALLTDSTGDTVLLMGVHITSLSTLHNGLMT